MQPVGFVTATAPGEIATPCHKCPKIPYGQPALPSSAVELSEKNLKTWWLYKQCCITNDFPKDPLFLDHCVALRLLEESLQREKQDDIVELLREIFYGTR